MPKKFSSQQNITIVTQKMSRSALLDYWLSLNKLRFNSVQPSLGKLWSVGELQREIVVLCLLHRMKTAVRKLQTASCCLRHLRESQMFHHASLHFMSVSQTPASFVLKPCASLWSAEQRSSGPWEGWSGGSQGCSGGPGRTADPGVGAAAQASTGAGKRGGQAQPHHRWIQATWEQAGRQSQQAGGERSRWMERESVTQDGWFSCTLSHVILNKGFNSI